MTISAKMICDSVSPGGIRLPTLQCRYPKFVHGEAKTHRMLRVGDKAYGFLEEVGFMDDPDLSRNASSSRAIPVGRMIQDVLDDPVIPLKWGRNRPGMQADEELDSHEREAAIKEWLAARDDAVRHVERLSRIGLHKQTANRILEPWLHINVVVTATEWNNFFALRDHEAAQPEIRELARCMREAMKQSEPKPLNPGEWHLPYVANKDIEKTFTVEDQWLLLTKLSVARCARVSYLTQDGRMPDVKEDLALYDRLVGSVPLHASPCEHQATPDTRYGYLIPGERSPTCERPWTYPSLHGNLRGWIQFRKTLENENVPG